MKIITLSVLLARTIKNGDCLEFVGAKHRAGYGIIRVNSKAYRTHRLAYTLAVGSIPEGLSVLHKCDNPPCINPAHLFIGTQKVNMQDMLKKGRSIRKGKPKRRLEVCSNGHPLSGDNLGINKKYGKRYCRECSRIASKRNREIKHTAF